MDAVNLNSLQTSTQTASPLSESLWDAFEHALMFLSLYGVAVSLGNMLHLLIAGPAYNLYDSLTSLFFYRFLGDYHSLLRFNIATLIICTPFFIYLFLDVTRRTFKYPRLRQLKARKFWIYATLIVTFIICITKIIMLVYNVISGELTSIYLLHFLVTAGIGGGIFGYYLYQVREDRQYYA